MQKQLKDLPAGTQFSFMVKPPAPVCVVTYNDGNTFSYRLLNGTKEIRYDVMPVKATHNLVTVLSEPDEVITVLHKANKIADNLGNGLLIAGSNTGKYYWAVEQPLMDLSNPKEYTEIDYPLYQQLLRFSSEVPKKADGSWNLY